MTMAVEGAKQLAEDEGLQVVGYELRDVHFQQPLMIPPEEEGIEVFMQFRSSVPDVSDSGLVVHAFVIDSLPPGQQQWRRNCAGRVLTHINLDENSTSTSHEHYKQRYENISAMCQHTMSPNAFYVELTGVGMAFGATLQNLVRISSSNGQASCNIKIPNTAATMPENWEYPHAIHPALLESLTHVMIPALMGPKPALKETLVPKFVESVYISSEITAKPGDELQGYATAKWHTNSLAGGNIVALDPRTNAPLVTITQMQYKTLPSWDVGMHEWQPTMETSTKYRKLCSQMRWDIHYESFCSRDIINVSRYFECLFHNNPSFKMLQIGGDPADTTSTLLRVATAHGSHPPLFLSLTYTAASARAIADAGIALAEWSTHIQFELLNIEEDLTEQNFEPSTYDLVIVDTSLQTPRRINHSMSQIKALMKPKGRLLIEGDAPKLADIDCGTLSFPDLDLGETIVHPAVTESWHTVMAKFGLTSGPMLRNSNAEEDMGRIKVIATATAGNDSDKSRLCGEALIVRPVNVDQRFSALMINIVGRLSELGYDTAIVDMYTATERTLESCLVISMAEVNEPLLSRLEPAQFEAVKSLVLRSKSLLWITMGGVMTGTSPEMNMASGFARTMRHETDSPNFATLDLGCVSQLDQTVNCSYYAHAVGKVALMLCEEDGETGFEREFAYQDGHLYVPRVDPLQDMNDWMNEPHGQHVSEKLRLDQVDCPVQMAWKTQGDIGDLFYKEDSATLNPIQDNHIQIEVKASALNMADLQSATEYLGLECAGVIIELGRDVHHLRQGDRVMAIGPGCHRTSVMTSEDLCQRIPENLSFQQGASIPFAYCTAYLALVVKANVKTRESVLIHESPNGIDQAAAEIALHLGAEVFVLTSSPEKRDFMTQKLHIAETHILALDKLELSRNLMRLTGGKGIDVVVGYSRGEIMKQSWHCIAKFGRFVDLYTSGGIENTTDLDMQPFQRSATFSSVDVVALLQSSPDQVSRIFRDIRCLLDQGIISPISQITSYNYSTTLESFETLRTGNVSGKIVLSAQNEDVVPVCQPASLYLIPFRLLPSQFVRTAPKPFRLNPDASYLLPGGLGGLGRSIAQWLVENGARSLIFLSRSGAHIRDAASFVTDLKAQGVQVGVYQCDISNLSQLEETIASCASILPPVRGVIQCAANFHDSAFENMNAEDWQAAIAPKVQGSWNLHNCLPHNMEFFIMLASIVGITGNRGQANYAAANAYQDALALHRRARGQAATSIDLSWIHEIGVVADRWDLMFKLRGAGFEGMKEHELHIVLEAAVTGKIHGRKGTTVPSQIITGVPSGGMIERSGARDLGWMNDAKFSYLKTVDSKDLKEARATGSDSSHLKRRLREASTKSDATAIIKEALMAKLVQSTGLDICDVDENEPIHALGLDSLVAIQIRGWAKRELKAEVSGVFILSSASIREVAATMAEGSELIDKANWE